MLIILLFFLSVNIRVIRGRPNEKGGLKTKRPEQGLGPVGTKKRMYGGMPLHRGGEEDSPRTFSRSTLYVVLVQELGNQFLDGRHIDS